jgi:putative DNA methylase
MTERLIEKWLPVAALGEESVRERRSMTALPPTYYLHVWWARRPLVASRAATLASLLPADADRDKFLHMLGIHGDPVASRRRIDDARRRGERFEGEAYSYKRAFTYNLDDNERAWLATQMGRLGIQGGAVLDPTAGGGSIPFEATRLGLTTFANDLNPVAALILRATVEFPARFGMEVVERFEELAAEFVRRREARLAPYFPAEPEPNCIPTNYIWARTIKCPYCDGLIPLSPNWRLAPDGTGVRLMPDTATRRCGFEIVKSEKAHSAGTVRAGDATCPFPDCERVVDGDEVKRQAQAGGMGEQLYAIVFKRRVVAKTKTGRETEKWQRGYRAPRPEDDNSAQIAAVLAEKLPEWEALDIVPTEPVPVGNKTSEPLRYGLVKWRDLFSPRQLLGHCTAVEVLQELVRELREVGRWNESVGAAAAYVTFSLDKWLNYNSRMSVWMPTREITANTFNRHDFAFCWSHAEMCALSFQDSDDWAFNQVGKALSELVALTRPDLTTGKKSARGAQSSLALSPARAVNVSVTNESGDALSTIDSGTVDAVVMDPPYYNNVMYAELSDFFYVWLKRTAGHVFPELFRRQLTDKESEAVANPAKFAGEKGAAALADRDYQERMAAIFAECRRVLKPDGVLTLMFTHKATGAWDALTSGLLEAGFTITASWPINTEAEGSLHIKDKAAANSTIFLVCRPRAPRDPDAEIKYWEDVEPEVGAAVRQTVTEYKSAGIKGVDLYLAAFGPALKVLAEHWPLRRGQPRPAALGGPKRRKAGADVDPYAVTPEDALDAARREVKAWRMEQLLRTNRKADLDPVTEWFVLAWDAFESPTFPYDEALRLARVVGVDLDTDIVGKLATKKGNDLVLMDSATRAAKGTLGPADGRRALIDALHHAAHRSRTHGLEAAVELLQANKVHEANGFVPALTALLEVLPVSSTFTHVEDDAGPIGAAAADFDALENLRRLAFSDRVPEPKQLELWKNPEA